VSLSNPQKAVMKAARELEDDDLAQGRGIDVGWDIATLLARAKQHEGGARASLRTVGAICRRCLMHRRSRDGRYELTTAGRVRLREGL
jgi:hypothetical protein